ncbi:MAG: glycosyltransferase family 1 protein [Thalassobaculum sp.]|uniref:glycosyltransferase family 4 protein n=1 Tax=Thalassobaculum sp. TaxID=2022740 RepID=UPI0032EB3F79
MHILIATDAWYPMINGVVRVIDSVRLRLFDRGHRVTVISPDQFASVPCPGYAEIPLAIAPQRRIRHFLKKDRPDVIHIATEGPIGWATRAACLSKGLPFTTAYHTKFPQYLTERLPIPLGWGYGALRRFHGPSRCVFSPSPSVAAELKERGFSNVLEWSHGVDTRTFRPRGKGFFDLPGPIFMYVGRIAVEKNLPAFLDLDLPGSKVVVGRGPDRDALMKRYPDVLFHVCHGDDELSRCYSAADAFVFPSRTDTFGLVMLEALACGVPVAAYPVPGPLDALGATGPIDAGHGVLNDDLRAAALAAVGKSPDACRAYAEKFDWDRVTDQFLANVVTLAAGPAATIAA